MAAMRSGGGRGDGSTDVDRVRAAHSDGESRGAATDRVRHLQVAGASALVAPVRSGRRTVRADVSTAPETASNRLLLSLQERSDTEAGVLTIAGHSRVAERREDLGHVAAEEPSVGHLGSKAGVSNDLHEEIDVVRQASHLIAAEGSLELRQRLGAGVSEGDELGDHGVVEGAHGVARHHARVHTHAVLLAQHTLQRGAQVHQLATRRKEIVLGILCVDSRLHSAALGAGDHFLLGNGEGLAGSHAQLQLHQVKASHHLSDGVLNLQSGVHLAEIKVLGDGVHKKLHGAGSDVSNSFCTGHRRVTHGLAHDRIQTVGRGLLQHLLVATLHRTVALQQMHHMAESVTENLQLDVSRVKNKLLQEDGIITERLQALSATGPQGLQERSLVKHRSHALTTTSSNSLNHKRPTNLACLFQQRFVRVVITVVSGGDRHSSSNHDSLALALAAHRTNSPRRRADEHNIGLFAKLAKVQIL
mmetsp:Transcript_45978/g.80380  ORF Transcript_45978/g.80380 Transcript_45978/m.80380 type:complete len:474 (-) Transcript_45978:388-1809(-)